MRFTGRVGVVALGCLLVACSGSGRDSTTGEPAGTSSAPAGSASADGTAAGSAPADSTAAGTAAAGSTAADSGTLSPTAVDGATTDATAADATAEATAGDATSPDSSADGTSADGTSAAEPSVMEGSGPLPTVDVSGVTGDPQALVDRVDIDRLMADVDTIAAGPRHAVDDHAAALEAAEYVRTEFAAAGLEPQSIDVTAFGVTLPTVWTEIPGKQCADRVFVITGHYDTVAGSPGADDDASGVAAVLELARVLADADLPATVVLAAVPFEEYGEPYHGAAALADTLIADGRTVTGMLSAEMLGYALPEPDADGDPGDYLLLIGYPGAEELVATFAAAGDRWARGFSARAGVFDTSSGFVGRSDHAAFHQRDIPAAFATDGANFRTPYYHGADDVPGNIDRDFLLGSVRTLTAGVIAATQLGVDGDAADCR